MTKKYSKKYNKAVEEQVALHAAFGTYAAHLRVQVVSSEISKRTEAERLEALHRVIERHGNRTAKIEIAERARLT